MKVFNIVWKILAALAIIAGIFYAVVKYGDKIVSWAKGMYNWCKDKCGYGVHLVGEEADFEVSEADFEGNA